MDDKKDQQQINEASNQSDTDRFELLGASMQGVQTTFSSAFSTLQRTLEQKVQMAETMTRIMKQLFQTNIKINSRLKFDQDTTRLTVTILNATPFPVIGLSGRIHFNPVMHAFSHPNTATDGLLHMKTDHMHSFFKVPTLNFCSASHYSAANELLSPSVPSIFISSETLDLSLILSPNTKHIEEFTIQNSQLNQYNGTIDIQVPLPGVDAGTDPVHLTRSFGLYLVDQMKKSIIHTADDITLLEQNEESKYRSRFLRDILEIDPVLGLEIGMLICLDASSSFTTESRIICKIEAISPDHESVQVRFFGNNKDLLRLLIHELDSLSN